jgi:6-phosphogluconolactonase
MTDTAAFDVLPDAGMVAEATADRFVGLAQDAIAERGVFRVALSGGGTPKQVYPRLLDGPRVRAVDWSAVEFFWGDERAVPPDHPDSNFGVAYQMLIAQLPGVRNDRIHRMAAEGSDLDGAALTYESEIRLAFDARGEAAPAFDLIWLGMGPDGHTASLFPGSAALDELDRWVVGNYAPSQAAWRMTMTFPLLDAAREALFVVTGADKAEALAAIRGGDRELPAGRVAASSVHWIVDRAAAGERNA